MSDSDKSLFESIAAINQRYIEALPDRIKGIEQYIFDLETKSQVDKSTKEIYREVHSLKGSAGTFGLSLVSVIAHNYEACLEQLNKNKSQATEYIDRLLVFNDLLYNYASDFSKHQDKNVTLFKTQLDKLLFRNLESISKNTKKILLVENASLISMQIKDLLHSKKHSVTALTDGIEALKHLLTITFDIIITSDQLPNINGMSLVNAIRVMQNPNKKTKTIVVTSNNFCSENYIYKPDHIIMKKGGFIQSLGKII